MSARDLRAIWLSDVLFMIGGAFGVGIPVAVVAIWLAR
jgi:hypothetical protein